MLTLDWTHPYKNIVLQVVDDNAYLPDYLSTCLLPYSDREFDILTRVSKIPTFPT